MTESSSDEFERKDDLYKRLKQTMHAKRKTSDKTANKLHPRSLKMMGNMNAQKNERKVDVGWLELTYREYRQVRIQSGCGIRHISIRHVSYATTTLNSTYVYTTYV